MELGEELEPAHCRESRPRFQQRLSATGDVTRLHPCGTQVHEHDRRIGRGSDRSEHTDRLLVFRDREFRLTARAVDLADVVVAGRDAALVADPFAESEARPVFGERILPPAHTPVQLADVRVHVGDAREIAQSVEDRDALPVAVDGLREIANAVGDAPQELQALREDRIRVVPLRVRDRSEQRFACRGELTA